MKFKTEILKIEHEDLVNLFSTALYGDNTFSVHVPNECKELRAPREGDDEGDCWEDDLARVLLHGGYLYVDDNETAVDVYDNFDEMKESLESEIYGDNTKGFVHYDKESECAIVRYKITLQRILDAFNTINSIDLIDSDDSDSRYIYENFQNTFVNESGDFYDAWNLLQYILFDEVMYG